VPLPWNDGWILRRAKEKNLDFPWPIKDQNGSYFVPTVSDVNVLFPPTGSTPSGSYLYDLLLTAKFNKSSNQFHILKALLPYAKEIKEDLGNKYDDLRALIPEYPDNP